MKKLILLTFCLLAILSGCSGSKPPLDSQAQGSTLALKISADISSLGKMKMQTIMPNENDMTIYRYELHGIGPEVEEITEVITLTELTDPSAQVTIDKLQPGKWNFTVTAKNADGVALGRGGAEVQIEAGETVTAPITISSLEDPGELKVNVSWPKMALATPTVEGILSNTAEGINTDITFLPGENGNSASYENTDLTAGNYMLTIQLMDGDKEIQKIEEAVLIWSDLTTEGNYFVHLGSVFEDFDDGTAGNFIDDASGRWAVVDGEYVLTGDQRRDLAYSYYDADFSDFTLSVDLMQTSGEYGMGYGVYFRSQDGTLQTGYLFGIAGADEGDEAWWYLGRVEGESAIAISDQWAKSEHINTGLNAVNNIKIVCLGERITIYINDQYIDWFYDDTYKKGKIGLQGYDDEFNSQAFKFDNFTILP